MKINVPLQENSSLNKLTPCAYVKRLSSQQLINTQEKLKLIKAASITFCTSFFQLVFLFNPDPAIDPCSP